MISKPRFCFLKILLLLFVFLALPGPGLLRAEVTISRTRLGGRPLTLFRNNWCEFQCLVENTDDVAHDVRVRVRSADGSPQTNYNTGSIRIPARTTSYLRFPVTAEGSKKYQTDLFCDGKKRPSGVMNTMLVNMYNNKQRRCFILSDGDETPGFLFDLKSTKEGLRPVTLSARDVPDTPIYYQNCDALMIVEPDFSRYSSSQIQSILAYVADGGTLVFASPKGALDAARTPLADLLPVTPLKTVQAGKIPLSELLQMQATLPEGRDFLVSVPCERGVVSAVYEGMPLFAEKQYGTGTVRLLAFAPLKEDFQGKKSVTNALFRRLMIRQDLYPNRMLFEDKLDQLTGFDIPNISEIGGLAAAYLAVFFVILLAGILFRRPGTAWFLSAAAAAGMIALVLHKANKSFGHRNSVLAEVTLEKAQPVRSGETFDSCFVNAGAMVRFEPAEETEVHFSTILRDPRISHYSKSFFSQPNAETKNAKKSRQKILKEQAVRIAVPLDILRSESGRESLPGLSLAPRTSREFMGQFYRPATEAVSVHPEKEPEVILSEKGMELVPYQLPRELMKIEKVSAWLILPGGIRSISISSSGECRLSGGNGLLVNEAARSMADVLCRGLRKPGPYLAFIGEAGKSFLSSNIPVLPQGKRILLIPARISVVSRTVKIPREFITFSPQDVGARFVVNGNDIVTTLPILTGSSMGLRISLPPQIASILKPEKLSLNMDFRVAESVSMTVSVRTPQGEKPCVKTARSEYQFTDFPESTRPDQAASLLIFLKTKHKVKPASLSPEQVMLANSWYMRAAEAEITGRLDDSVSLPARF